MKKLKLNLDEIKVESFIVNNKDKNGGTVLGAEVFTYYCDTEEECVSGVSCGATCITCAGNTCDGTCDASCNGTCGASCNGTCYNECKSIVYYCETSVLWTCSWGTNYGQGCIFCGA